MIYQRTLAQKAVVTGLGIHSGKRVTLSLYPASSDCGIQFKRIDLGENTPPLKACATKVGATENNTTIGQGENVVHTVEHLLSVLYGLGINNVYCEIDGPEVPIMDGSGASFMFLLREAGIATLNKMKKFMVILETVRVEVEDKWATIGPSSKFIVDSTIAFPHPKIKNQQKLFEFSCQNYIDEIVRARTFGLLKDLDMLKRKGLIKGGSLNNAIVLDEFKVMNEDGLRFKDEFVRHKILDILGDVALLGHELVGKITTYKSGHNLHNLLCRKLLTMPSAFAIVSAASLEEETLRPFLPPFALTTTKVS